MKPSILLIMLFIFLGQVALVAELPPETISYIKKLNTLYQKGQSREQIKAYAPAALAYKEVLSRTMQVINDLEKSEDKVNSMMPYAIGASYRLGIITHQINAGSADKLYDQLENYKKTQDWIDEILTSITNLQIERGIIIPKNQYSHLYFSRAYNRVSWAAALMRGNAWKRYFIYMPSDIVSMIGVSIQDLQTLFTNYGIKKYNDEESVSANMNLLFESVNTASRDEQLTFKLSFYNPSLENALNSMEENISRRAQNTLALFESPAIQGGLTLADDLQNIDEYTSETGKPFFYAVTELQKALGQRSI
ncbi:MAG: hypothetical protein ABIH39_02110 [Candidatus Margulisiibacteriota bacterium]